VSEITTEIAEPCVLIVEGIEEKYFFGAFIEHLGLQDIQVMPIGGKRKLRENLGALTLAPGFVNVTSLGIVRDANSDPDPFQSVCEALRAVNLPVPERPLVPTGHSPRVTVMILPGDKTPGMLEDLCLRAVAQDPAMLCVEHYFQCLQQQGLSLPRNISKAKAQVFLASKPEVGIRLGVAAEKGYWPWGDEAFNQVRSFLQQISS
jgi:hypothetical protein